MKEGRTEPGKIVGRARYVHVSIMDRLGAKERECIKRARTAGIRAFRDYNVVKVMGAHKVSLLDYADFFDAPFPRLRRGWTVDAETGVLRYKSYAKSKNPPILHRKELLLDPAHPRVPEYEALTKAAEEAALFCDPSKIGFRKQWEQRLAEAGLRLKGHTLVPAGGKEESGHVSRSKT